MFRLAVAVTRWIRRIIPAERPVILAKRQAGVQGFRQVSNVENAIAPSNNQQSITGIQYRPFFGHWLKKHTTYLKYSPMYRSIAKQRNSLFLAFVGFTFAGHKQDPDSKKSTIQNIQFDKKLQDTLKNAFQEIPEKLVNVEGLRLKDFEMKDSERLGKPSSNSAVYTAKRNGSEFAIKRLFNFGTSSESHSLRQAFLKELTVLSHPRNQNNSEETSRYKTLPPHANIMKISGSFADSADEFFDSAKSYPAALPPRIHPDGLGRNRTLYYIMPRLECTLSEYISTQREGLSTRISLALFAQLLEGLEHLKKNGVAHRDLKMDNLLVNWSLKGLPHLVIADFDCCLAEKNLGLTMPYETAETNKGGNIALMAPEVIFAEPGRGHVIDYNKSDEWSAGVLAYEIFGQISPFEEHDITKKTYNSDNLPAVESAPKAVQKLVKQMLQRDPNDRPDICLAATVIQLLLWAPDLCNLSSYPDVLLENIRSWFRVEMFELTLEMMQYRDKVKDDITVERQILYTFLSRTTTGEIMEALEWLASSKEQTARMSCLADHP